MANIKVFHCPDCKMPLIPGDVSCLKCGKRFAQPIPKVEVTSQIKAQAEFQDPILEGTKYLCPKCRVVLEPGSTQCCGCAVPFAYPVPVYKMSFREAEQLKREQEQAKREQEQAKREQEKLERAEKARQKAEVQELKKEEAWRKAKVLKDKFAAAVKPVPGTYEEQEAYNQARVQEATARMEAEREAKEREGIAYAEAHSCPHCQAPQTPGSYVCVSCGAIFDEPTAQPRRKFKTLSEKPLTQFEKSFLSFIALLVIGGVGGGIWTIVDSSHSPTIASTYTSPPMVTDQSSQSSISQMPQPAVQIPAQEQPVSPQQNYDPKFADDDQDARNKFPGSSSDYNSDFQMLVSEGMGEDDVAKLIGASAQASSMTGTDINTLIYVAHAYYVREPSTSDRTQAMEQDMETLAKCEAKEPGIGVFELALQAANGASAEYVAEKSQILNFQLSGIDALNGDKNPNNSSVADTIWKLVTNKPH